MVVISKSMERGIAMISDVEPQNLLKWNSNKKNEDVEIYFLYVILSYLLAGE